MIWRSPCPDHKSFKPRKDRPHELEIITGRAPGTGPSIVKWVGGSIAALLIWGLVYSQLVPFSEWVVSLASIDPDSHLGEALSFFVYDTPRC